MQTKSEGGCYKFYKCDRTEHTHSAEQCGLRCTLKVHNHKDSGCTKRNGRFTCGLQEHTHGDGCYSCNKSAHTHNNSCKYGQPKFDCKITEHTHNVKDKCFACTVQEHTHNIYTCYDWPNATVTATANEGYYIQSMTGTGQTESIPQGATSYVSTFKMDKDRTVKGDI